MDTGLARPPAATGFRRLAYIALGLFFVGLAVIGVLTPGIPATPFLLLATWFFSRSSQRLNNWILRSRVFGGILRDWQIHRGVRPRVKIFTLTLLPVVAFCSAWFGRLPWYLVVMLVVLASIGFIVVLRLPVVRDPAPASLPLPTPNPAAESIPIRS